MSLLVEEPASPHAFAGSDEAVKIPEQDVQTTPRPSLTLSPSAFATLPSYLTVGGAGRPLYSPALIPLMSPAIQDGMLLASPKLSSRVPSTESSPGPVTPITPLTPLPKAFGQIHIGSIRSPVPWKLGFSIPAAPHLSEDKESFSPLPRTPDGNNSSGNSPFSGGSVFAKMQEKYLAECASSNKGQDSPTPTSPSTPLLLAPSPRSMAGHGAAAGLGLARRSSLGPSTGASELSPYARRHEGWNRRPSLLGAEPVKYHSFGGWAGSNDRDGIINGAVQGSVEEVIGDDCLAASEGEVETSHGAVGRAASGHKNGLLLDGIGDDIDYTEDREVEDAEDDEPTTASGIKFTVTVDGKCSGEVEPEFVSLGKEEAVLA